MSLRNVRKLYGGNSLPPPDSSDDDYEPLYVKAHSAFEGLAVSDGESENVPPVEPDADEEKTAVEQNTPSTSQGARKKQKQPQNKKQKHKSKAKAKKFRSFAGAEDEVERSLRDVNALLGEPPPAPPQLEVRENETRGVLSTVAKHLNVNNELRRLFGPMDPADVAKAKQQSSLLKRVAVLPLLDTNLYDFKRNGLSMSVNRRENGLTYFTFDHNADYQRLHRSFLRIYSHELHEHMLRIYTDYRDSMHMEALLEVCDVMFHVEEYTISNKIIENVVAYLQHIAHPSFNLTSGNVRLEYKYLENRPFFVVMLKYAYALTTKACHRTALEIAKMLLNLDPEDPVAVLFVIDTLALRAREHQWLIDACAHFDRERNASMLFNIQYSNALAHYHVVKQNRDDMFVADKLLQNAMLGFPYVTVKILELINQRPASIFEHALFQKEPRTNVNAALNELIEVYATMTWQRWREPGVLDWFLKNANEICHNYNNSEPVRETAKSLADARRDLFPRWAKEVCRHFAIVEPMAPLVLEMNLKEISRDSCTWNPLFDRGVNRYNYMGMTTGMPAAPRPQGLLAPHAPGAAVYSFFASMLPNYDADEET